MMDEALNALEVEFLAQWVTRRPDEHMVDMPIGSNHYEVTLRRNGTSATFYYSMGPDCKEGAKLEDVLYFLVSDALAGEESFEDFVSDNGYTDIDDARRTYDACVENAEKLKGLFPDKSIHDLWEVVSEY